jgi:proline iminopeptidase
MPISLETDLADIDAVRQAVGAERVHLLGMSYYGALVALYAAEHPDHADHVVMVGPMAPTAELFVDRTPTDYSTHPDYVELDRMRRDGVHESDPVAFCRQYYKAHALELYNDPSRFDADELTYCELENEWPDNFLQWAGMLFASIGTWDFTAKAAEVRSPVLVIQGRQDQITPPGGASAWTEAMKNQARLVWLDDCGHTALKEQPDETRALILEFLGGSSNPAAQQ